MNKKIALIALFLSVVTGCEFRRKSPHKGKPAPATIKQIPETPKTIAVYVHGSVLPDFWKRMPPFRNFFHFPPGITPIKDFEKKYTVSNFQELYKIDPEQFHPETLYLYGWSGKMCYKGRYQAAQNLYNHLVELQKKHPGLPITIMTHSHGGNVALNLARIAREQNNNNLVIDRLVLFACPVQSATQDFVHDPLFKNVYVFYSPIDLFQVIDPQGLHQNLLDTDMAKPSSFSWRRFPENPKLHHARIRMNGWYFKHGDYLYKPFLRNLPKVLNDLGDPEVRATIRKVKGCKCNDYMLRLKS